MPTRPGFRIFAIAGIPIYVHPTWLVIFVLITWTLESQYRTGHPDWSASQNWLVGIATSLLFFASVLFHEMAHSLVAQRYKIKVLSITLFIFGGVARIEREPSKAIQEFNIAVAGPVASAFLAVAFYLLSSRFAETSMIGNLAILVCGANALLGLFNLLPGFPLDGGRIFRAIVWGITRDFSRATRAAGFTGKLVAYAMILFGAWRALGKSISVPVIGTIPGDFVGGLWTAFIGWFILNAAQESVAQVEVRETLSGLRAQDVMSHEVPTFPGGNTLEDYAAEVLRTGRRFHLVLTDDRLTGMMNVNALNGVPQHEWAGTSVQGVMVPREHILWARPEEPLLVLLERLLANEVNQMPVVSESPGEGNEGDMHIIGMVTRDSILRVIQTRSELGTEALRAK
jgi:Zn-dependent protease